MERMFFLKSPFYLHNYVFAARVSASYKDWDLGLPTRNDDIAGRRL